MKNYRFLKAIFFTTVLLSQNAFAITNESTLLSIGAAYRYLGFKFAHNYVNKPNSPIPLDSLDTLLKRTPAESHARRRTKSDRSSELAPFAPINQGPSELGELLDRAQILNIDSKERIRIFYDEFISQLRKMSLTVQKTLERNDARHVLAANLRRATMPPSHIDWTETDISETLDRLAILAEGTEGAQRTALDAILTVVFNSRAQGDNQISSFLTARKPTVGSPCVDELAEE